MTPLQLAQRKVRRLTSQLNECRAQQAAKSTTPKSGPREDRKCDLCGFGVTAAMKVSCLTADCPLHDGPDNDYGH